ncbi:DNA-binding protein eta2 [Tritrichomonas foetus]|uniref:DNA-binding protein eta2 n=1 Tax=Tritrichomonas foetus TaxID=1144522 RepID=A0A1J4JNN1_9EUKA|nr:DNA-binding protein eta2 [Tritrichomonas foetus]|eukprot:OHT00729.1 DNA-binding protein eta2 [Tritrichomonas foetus]
MIAADFPSTVIHQDITCLNMIDTQKPRHRKVRFTKDQDSLIKQLAEKNPPLKWRDIAEKIPGKSPKQCRERYQHFLAPTVLRIPWTLEEDALLIHCHYYFGTDWAKIAKFFPGRTNNDVKNRYNGRLKEKELDTFLAVMEQGKNSFLPQKI